MSSVGKFDFTLTHGWMSCRNIFQDKKLNKNKFNSSSMWDRMFPDSIVYVTKNGKMLLKLRNILIRNAGHYDKELENTKMNQTKVLPLLRLRIY